MPSLIALFLYGLLPIVRGTYSGLTAIDPRLIESAKSLGLVRWARIIHVEIPLSAIHILSGIRTSATITVGTATLAALIGAGGYGTLILTGLALNDIPTVLQGAVPAAIMAIVVHLAFELLEPLLISKGLRLN